MCYTVVCLAVFAVFFMLNSLISPRIQHFVHYMYSLYFLRKVAG